MNLVLIKNHREFAELDSIPSKTGDDPAQSRSSNFRLQNQRIMLTYRSHIPKETFISWLQQTTGIQPEFIRIAHETADSKNPYLHSHVVIDFGKQFNTKDCRKFDFTSIHPHIQPLSSKAHFYNAKRYLAKEDPDNADLLEGDDDTLSLAERVWSSDNMHQMLVSHCKKPSDVQGLKTLYKMKRHEARNMPNFTFRPWQAELNQELNTPGNGRQILWIIDKRGGSGKTKFTQYLAKTNPEKYHKFRCLPGSYHGARLIAEALEQGWTGNTLILDLTRSEEKHEGIYSILEAAIDGEITTVKYSGYTTYFDCERVLVVANWAPDVKRCSLDRWDIRSLDLHQPGGEPIWRLTKKNVNDFLVAEPEVPAPHTYNPNDIPQPSFFGLPGIHSAYTPMSGLPTHTVRQ